MAVITISRQQCSFGNEIAAALAQKLGFELITHETLLSKFFSDATAHERHMLTESVKFYLTENEQGITYLNLLISALREYAQKNDCVMVGFGSQAIFAKDRDALHIRVFAPDYLRISRLMRQYRVSEEQAVQILEKTDKKQKKFVSALFGISITDVSHYHMLLNTCTLTVDECVAAIIAMHNQHAVIERIEQETHECAAQCHLSDVALLKNKSETEFARLLDMYHIDWIYEPKTFPVEWDAAGNVTSAFSPDFYLPKFNTYIELTTMNQKYVTEKNKKIKKLRELYPGTNIKIVYKKDFHSLLGRFNPNGE